MAAISVFPAIFLFRFAPQKGFPLKPGCKAVIFSNEVIKTKFSKPYLHSTGCKINGRLK